MTAVPTEFTGIRIIRFENVWELGGSGNRGQWEWVRWEPGGRGTEASGQAGMLGPSDTGL